MLNITTNMETALFVLQMVESAHEKTGGFND